MEQVDSAVDSATQAKNLNPHKLLPLDDSAGIIASHDKLQQWNNATEAALKENADDTAVVQNARNTAALIALTGRSMTSQSYELMRSMNISDSTLSAASLAKGFVEGTLDEMMAPVRKLVEMQRPSDMNLQHAKMRAEVLESSIIQIGTKTLDAVVVAGQHVKSAWDNPDHITDAVNGVARDMHNGLQAEVEKLPQNLASGLMNKDAEQRLGFSFGVATIGMLRNAASSSGRLMRDFSEQMHFSDMSKAVKMVEYKPDAEHFIIGHVINGTLRYEIKKSDGNQWGHGNEMLASMIEKFQKNGVVIERMQGAMMTEGPSSSIGQQYLRALAAGHTSEEAAFMTLTGQHAKALGMNHVIVPPMSPMDKSLHPLFSKEPYQHKSGDERSSIDGLTDKDLVVGQLKSLNLPADKEQMIIAHVEKNFENQSREDSISV